jgi:hypothetical protein
MEFSQEFRHFCKTRNYDLQRQGKVQKQVWWIHFYSNIDINHTFFCLQAESDDQKNG